MAEETKQQQDNSETEVKTFTQEELDKIVKERLDKQAKKYEAEKSEAKKLAKMNADDKQKYEMDKREQDLAAREQDLARRELLAETKLLLTSKNLSSDFAEFVIGVDADDTNKRLEAFEKEFSKAVEKQVAEKLATGVPKKAQQNRLTREEIFKVQDRAERQRLIAENADLF